VKYAKKALQPRPNTTCSSRNRHRHTGMRCTYSTHTVHPTHRLPDCRGWPQSSLHYYAWCTGERLPSGTPAQCTAVARCELLVLRT
jgi:hypothetical protein